MVLPQPVRGRCAVGSCPLSGMTLKERNEAAVPEMTVCGPSRNSKRATSVGASHRQSFILSAVRPSPHRLGLGSGKLTNGYSVTSNVFILRSSSARNEGVNPLRVRDTYSILVHKMSDYDGIEGASADGIAANDEILRLVQAHLHPGARALSRFVFAVGALGDQPFQALRTY